MNIFALDYDPYKAAIMHCDQHVNKMIVESCQLLSTCCRSLGEDRGYKSVSAKHPCALWLLESRANYRWLWSLCRGLLLERLFRYPLSGSHASTGVHRLLRNAPRLPNRPLTPFRRAFAGFVSPCRDSVDAYRDFYHSTKLFATWERGREKPLWILRVQSCSD